jgi:hypothetical protein
VRGRGAEVCDADDEEHEECVCGGAGRGAEVCGVDDEEHADGTDDERCDLGRDVSRTSRTDSPNCRPPTASLSSSPSFPTVRSLKEVSSQR